VKIKISIDIYTGINCKHLKANFRNSLSIPVVSSTANKLRLLFTNKSKIKIKRNSIKNNILPSYRLSEEIRSRKQSLLVHIKLKTEMACHLNQI